MEVDAQSGACLMCFSATCYHLKATSPRAVVCLWKQEKIHFTPIQTLCFFSASSRFLQPHQQCKKAAVFLLQHHLALPFLLDCSLIAHHHFLNDSCGEWSVAEHWHHIQTLVVAQLLYHQEVLSLSKWPPHFQKIQIELLGSSFDGFIYSKVGTCGSEMSDGKNRDKKKYTKIHNRVWRATQWILNSPCLFFICFIKSNPKGVEGERRQKTILPWYKNKQSNYLFSTWNIEHLYPELSILLFR